MSVRDDAEGPGEMTLAFELSAVRRLADPEAAFEDAREWSRYVGVVANDTEAVDAFLDRHDLRHDFDLEGRDKWLAMQGIRNSAATPRHVYVAEIPEDRRLADQLGWEFLTPTEAAEKAGWELAETGSTDGTDGGSYVSRWRDRLRNSSVWPFGRR